MVGQKKGTGKKAGLKVPSISFYQNVLTTVQYGSVRPCSTGVNDGQENGEPVFFNAGRSQSSLVGTKDWKLLDCESETGKIP